MIICWRLTFAQANPEWTKPDQDRAEKLLALWIGSSVMPVQAVDHRGLLHFTKCLRPQVLCCFKMYHSEWFLTIRYKIGSQSFANALWFMDPIMNGFYCPITVHWTIILIHILSVHFAINAQDDSAHHGGGQRGAPSDWRSAQGCSARLHHNGCLDLEVV